MPLGMRTVNTQEAIDPSMTIDEVMRRWPATLKVMLRNRMLCIGCPIAIFHSVADVCDAHGIDREILAGELLEAMRKQATAGRALRGRRR